MPTFVQSAMNPNGTWQSDAMDGVEEANRQATFQAAQMQNQIAAQQLQARLEQMRMNQQGTQFEEGRADQLGMHNSTLENENRMQQAGFGQEDKWRGLELAAKNHAVDVEDSWRQRTYGDMLAQRQREWDYLTGGGLGGGPASAQSGEAYPGQSHDMAAMRQMPADSAGPMAGYGGGAMPSPQHASAQAGGMSAPAGVDPMLYRAAVLSMMHGGSMPDFFAQGIGHAQQQAGLDEQMRGIAAKRISDALASGNIDQAKALSAQSGQPLPAVDATQFAASSPAVQQSLAVLSQKALLASKATDVNGAISALQPDIAMVIKTMTDHGVQPQDAHAIVLQALDKVMPHANIFRHPLLGLANMLPVDAYAATSEAQARDQLGLSR